MPIPGGRRISEVMSLVDDYEIEVLSRMWFSAQTFEGQEWNALIHPERLLPPHIAQGSWTNDARTAELSCNRERDERLSHSHFIREECSAELADGRTQAPRR
jgi:hypothetical protein